MPNFGDFSSLLQLGVGVGIGLSVFRAPVDVRTSRISKTLDTEIGALRGSTTEFAIRKRRDLFQLKLRFASKLLTLGKTQTPCMYFAIIGAAINLAALIFASWHASEIIRDWCSYTFVFFSTAYFLLLLGFLEVAARRQLSEIQQELASIQMRQNIGIT